MNLPTTDGGFGVIYMDAPWKTITYDGRKAVPTSKAGDPYKTMTRAELMAMPVPEVAAKNCALFMWVIDSHMDQAWELAKAFGFTFKSIAFVWLKRDPLDERQVTMLRPINKPAKISMGYTTRKQAELCLLFTRGKPKRLSKGVRQVIEAARREHSRKPDEAARRIEALYPGPYLELFARCERPKWTVFGNETTKFSEAAE